MPRSAPLIRSLQLLQRLQSCHAAGRGARLDELAELAGVDQRTVRRVVQALEEAGFRVFREIDEENRARFCVDSTQTAPGGVCFEPAEAAALYVATGMMEAMEGLPIAKEAREALDKVEECVPPPFRGELKRYVEALQGSLHGRHEYETLGLMYDDLIDAIGERWRTEIDYQSPGRDEPRTHLVDPYLIHCHAGTVYLVARMEGRQTLSTFALDRVKAVRPRLEEIFVRDPDFEAERFVGESFGGWHEGDVVDVRVRFRAEVAPLIRERVWHSSQQLDELPGGELDLRLRTAGPTGVLHWAKAFLPHARILEPTWLAEQQVAQARAWLDDLASG